MTFDVVVGNPPYNDDMYLDFIAKTHEIITPGTGVGSMIVPGKWSCKDGDKNIKFRYELVPYMSDIVFYPDCLDVFGISEAGGITYYLMDTNKHDTINITNKANYQPLVNSTEVRSIQNGESLWNIGNQIIQKLHGEKYLFKPIDDNYRLTYTVSISKMWCGSRVSSGAWDFETSSIKPDCIGKGGVIFNPTGDIKVLGKIQILGKDEQPTENDEFEYSDYEYSDSGSAINIFTSDSKDEIESFLSWINTKFISFLILVYISSSTIMKEITWRNIPHPGTFDHIFTDQELYKKYNLTDVEINVIESIIKKN